MKTQNETYHLSHAEKQKIDHWTQKYPADQKRSALLPALHIVQDANQNYLTENMIEAVATYLDLPAIWAFEVATFYTMYNLKPVGKHQINFCTNISCMLRNCDEIADHFKQKLGINFNETTPDGKFTLREVECLAACANAPACLIDKTYYKNLTKEKVDRILDELS